MLMLYLQSDWPSKASWSLKILDTYGDSFSPWNHDSHLLDNSVDEKPSDYAWKKNDNDPIWMLKFFIIINSLMDERSYWDVFLRLAMVKGLGIVLVIY